MHVVLAFDELRSIIRDEVTLNQAVALRPPCMEHAVPGHTTRPPKRVDTRERGEALSRALRIPTIAHINKCQLALTLNIPAPKPLIG
jgi:hypothetical protein